MNYITPDIEVKNVFSELENSSELISKSIRGISLYAVCRFYFEMCYRIWYYQSINSEKGFVNYSSFSPSNQVKKLSFFPRISKKFNHAIEDYQLKRKKSKFYKQFDKLDSEIPQTDFLFVATSGYKDEKNYSIELFDVIKAFKEKKQKVFFVLPNYDLTIKRREEYDYLFSIDLNCTSKFSESESELILEFQNIVKKLMPFLSESNLAGIKHHISYSFCMSEQLQKVILAVKPKYVIGRSLYTDKWVPLACKMGVSGCVEIQHGAFTENNFYYKSLGLLTHSNLLLPDFLFLLGREWMNIASKTNSYWNHKNSGIIGSELYQSAKEKKRQRKNITIAFQDFGTDILDIRNDIALFFEKSSDDLNDINFTLRIHPANSIDEIGFLSKYKNVKFSDPKNQTVNELLFETDILICATSMLLYEAINRSIPVISFERYRKMCESTYINFVVDYDHLYKIIKENKIIEPTHIEYLNPFSMNDFNAVLV